MLVHRYLFQSLFAHRYKRVTSSTHLLRSATMASDANMVTIPPTDGPNPNSKSAGGLARIVLYVTGLNDCA